MGTVDSTVRIASTAAPSAPSLSPRPTQRDAAIAALSVTRTSSSARLRSGAFIAPRYSAAWRDAKRPGPGWDQGPIPVRAGVDRSGGPASAGPVRMSFVFARSHTTQAGGAEFATELTADLIVTIADELFGDVGVEVHGGAFR